VKPNWDTNEGISGTLISGETFNWKSRPQLNVGCNNQNNNSFSVQLPLFIQFNISNSI